MQVVELDPPKAPVADASVAPITHAPITPAKSRQPADPRPHVATQARATSPVPSKPDVRSAQSVVPAAQSPQSAQSAQSAQPAQSPQSAPPTEEAKPSAEPPAHATAPSEESANTRSSGDATAHALSQPLPELPDDLREQAYQTVATARFAIHVDGSVEVDLIKPTSNPRLNQILLDALRKWRFFPAMQAGHPVESRQDIRVHFNVN
ncbi:TonB family protein [Paraburkholderia sediminicola]|uniref:energy transducer TonB n=1 Tax=Paraburkholderia sediminicola TaxID=458836 RepID=UPI0038BBB863